MVFPQLLQRVLQYFSGSVIVPHEIDICPKFMLRRSYSFTYSGNVEVQSVYKVAICTFKRPL